MDPLEALDLRIKVLEEKVGSGNLNENSNVQCEIEKIKRKLRMKNYGFLLDMSKKEAINLDKIRSEINKQDINEKYFAISCAEGKIIQCCKYLEEVEKLSGILDSKDFEDIPKHDEKLEEIKKGLIPVLEEGRNMVDEIRRTKVELIEVLKILQENCDKVEEVCKQNCSSA
uniref:Uncharacterized protein n=1 Tax=Parastrongyloides trichosuri TaxID=131310 RepID=A0A0N5A671_PARTI